MRNGLPALGYDKTLGLQSVQEAQALCLELGCANLFHEYMTILCD